MAKLDANQTSITDMANTVQDWTPDTGTLDESNDNGETKYSFPRANEYLGYFQQLPEVQNSVGILSDYVTGSGWSSPSNKTTQMLTNMTGNGMDTFESIIDNSFSSKKYQGDSMSEVMRNDNGDLINLKPLYIGNMSTVTNESGMLVRYEQHSKGKIKKFRPDQILHLVNKRTANEIHGTSIMIANMWAVDAKNEALDTMRKIQRRQLAMGSLEVDSEDETKVATIVSKYQQAVDRGDVIVTMKGLTELKGAPANQVIAALQVWIQYLDEFAWRSLRVPLVLAGGSAGSEGSDKTGFATFDQVWQREQRELSADLWRQLAIRVVFGAAASILPSAVSNQEKNTSQTGFQPKEVTATVERE